VKSCMKVQVFTFDKKNKRFPVYCQVLSVLKIFYDVAVNQGKAFK